MDAKSTATIETVPKSHCYLCGAVGDWLYRELRDTVFSAPGTWGVRTCSRRSCGLIWMDPAPTPEGTAATYAGYYTHSTPGENVVPKRARLRRVYDAALRFTGVQRLRERHQQMYLRDAPPGRLLDVGCGHGARLAGFRARGWEVVGQEIDPEAAEYARRTHGVEVRIGPLEEVDLPSEQFDAVVMAHVIEHVHDPVGLLSECLRVLVPGGILVATTPNGRSLSHRYFRAAWRGLEIPRHLHVFTPETLSEVARRAGFREYRTKATAANAEGIGLESLNIQRDGEHRAGRHSAVGRHLWAMGFQAVAMLNSLVDSGAGDECVLIARR